jgi:prephenate dehydrogenase
VNPIDRVAIIGLGLMGGSLARALSARDVFVLGHDRRGDTLEAAMRSGAVREALDLRAGGDVDADVVVLATPIDAVLTALPELAPRLSRARLVMDLSSTKASIVAAAEVTPVRDRFVGAHPLTGSHRSGWYAARASLFDDARVFLSPTPSARPEVVTLATEFWRALRAGVEIIDAHEHDVQMAWRSHLPHMLSVSLALTLDAARIDRGSLGPGGRDLTRLAGGPPSMWTPIAEDNDAALVDAISAFEEQLGRLKAVIRDGHSTEINALLGKGVAWFDGEPSPGLREHRAGKADIPS